MNEKYDCSSFLDSLAGDSAAPGGGSASAMAGSMAAALASMVAGLTIGKKKFAEVEAGMIVLKEQALVLKNRLAELVEREELPIARPHGVLPDRVGADGEGVAGNVTLVVGEGSS